MSDNGVKRAVTEPRPGGRERGLGGGADPALWGTGDPVLPLLPGCGPEAVGQLSLLYGVQVVLTSHDRFELAPAGPPAGVAAAPVAAGPLPQWLADDGELWYAGTRVRTVAASGGNVRLLLAAFQAVKWNAIVENPFQHLAKDGFNVALMLRRTVASLNVACR